jgi:2-oxo-4-hydroxy-4-carboxy-5-ureidoimidazoline decarboxylase
MSRCWFRPGLTVPIEAVEMSYSLSELNQMTQADFVAALGAVFEDTPAIAQQVWHRCPFQDRSELYRSMVDVVKSASPAEKLALIRAHPDLGSKAKMAVASVQEQAGAGLDRLSPEEYDRLTAFNRAYREKFGFPFIITVKKHTKTSILEAFAHRLENPSETEINQALSEITQIAEFRLLELVQS